MERIRSIERITSSTIPQHPYVNAPINGLHCQCIIGKINNSARHYLDVVRQVAVRFGDVHLKNFDTLVSEITVCGACPS